MRLEKRGPSSEGRPTGKWDAPPEVRQSAARQECVPGDVRSGGAVHEQGSAGPLARAEHDPVGGRSVEIVSGLARPGLVCIGVMKHQSWSAYERVFEPSAPALRCDASFPFRDRVPSSTSVHFPLTGNRACLT